MSMLARYKKQGGINQLVALLETCLSKKRETLMNSVIAEDPVFAKQVQDKILNCEKIFKWDPLLVCEATSRLSDRTLAIALKGLPPECFAIATHTMRELKKKEITNLLETIKPTPIEIESAHIKLVEKVRELEKEGTVKFGPDNLPVKRTA